MNGRRIGATLAVGGALIAGTLGGPSNVAGQDIAPAAESIESAAVTFEKKDEQDAFIDEANDATQNDDRGLGETGPDPADTSGGATESVDVGTFDADGQLSPEGDESAAGNGQQDPGVDVNDPYSEW